MHRHQPFLLAFLTLAPAFLLLTSCRDSKSLVTASCENIPLSEARKQFRTKLTRHLRSEAPLAEPPAGEFDIVRYATPLGSMGAYLSKIPKDGHKHPAIVWITNGRTNGVDESIWAPPNPAHDLSARAFPANGIVTMYPSFRGGNDNPGCREGFYGEVQDVLAAGNYLSRCEGIDRNRIYLGGYDSGATLALLVAESSKQFRAVFAVGPTDQITNYRSKFLPFDRRDPRESLLRSPIEWLESIQTPTFIFEGTAGNIDVLQHFAATRRSPKVQLCPVECENHQSEAFRVTHDIAAKLKEDTSFSVHLEFAAR